MRRIYPSNYTSNLKNALKPQFEKINAIKPKTKKIVDPVTAQVTEVEMTSTFKLLNRKPVEFLTFGETEYTKNQKEIHRQEKLKNALTASYTVTDKKGTEIKIRVPERLKSLVE